jgi:carboxymethylenebutenolidase
MFWKQRILSLAPLAMLACLAVPAAAEENKTPSRSFTVGDKSIRVEHFAPAGEGEHPAVILVHGTAGLEGKEGEKGDAELYRWCARLLAGQGYHALVVHYFDSTGTKRIDPREVQNNKKLFRTWTETVRESVRYTTKLPGVDKKRIGLIGFSLGAYLSLAVAGESDAPVAAVVDLFGGLPELFHDRAYKLPPTLIIHGNADKVVPVREARDLEKLLQKHKRPYDIKIYEKADHLFGGNMLSRDALDAQKRTLDFLAKHLKPELGVAGRAP